MARSRYNKNIRKQKARGTGYKPNRTRGRTTTDCQQNGEHCSGVDLCCSGLQCVSHGMGGQWCEPFGPEPQPQHTLKRGGRVKPNLDVFKRGGSPSVLNKRKPSINSPQGGHSIHDRLPKKLKKQIQPTISVQQGEPFVVNQVQTNIPGNAIPIQPNGSNLNHLDKTKDGRRSDRSYCTAHSECGPGRYCDGYSNNFQGPTGLWGCWYCMSPAGDYPCMTDDSCGGTGSCSDGTGFDHCGCHGPNGQGSWNWCEGSGCVLPWTGESVDCSIFNYNDCLCGAGFGTWNGWVGPAPAGLFYPDFPLFMDAFGNFYYIPSGIWPNSGGTAGEWGPNCIDNLNDLAGEYGYFDYDPGTSYDDSLETCEDWWGSGWCNNQNNWLARSNCDAATTGCYACCAGNGSCANHMIDQDGTYTDCTDKQCKKCSSYSNAQYKTGHVCGSCSWDGGRGDAAINNCLNNCLECSDVTTTHYCTGGYYSNVRGQSIPCAVLTDGCCANASGYSGNFNISCSGCWCTNTETGGYSENDSFDCSGNVSWCGALYFQGQCQSHAVTTCNAANPGGDNGDNGGSDGEYHDSHSSVLQDICFHWEDHDEYPNGACTTFNAVFGPPFGEGWSEFVENSEWCNTIGYVSHPGWGSTTCVDEYHVWCSSAPGYGASNTRIPCQPSGYIASNQWNNGWPPPGSSGVIVPGGSGDDLFTGGMKDWPVKLPPKKFERRSGGGVKTKPKRSGGKSWNPKKQKFSRGRDSNQIVGANTVKKSRSVHTFNTTGAGEKEIRKRCRNEEGKINCLKIRGCKWNDGENVCH